MSEADRGPANAPAVRRPARPCCWACGAAAACGSHLRRDGWFARRIAHRASLAVFTEVYCPPCFGAHGWPALTGGWELEGRRQGR